uniref:(northern house mosquito) hypothetical protein n=1 Tax=Culex pipiens TaxID=7175 RepID=A0A8D8F953_CULPI
MRLHCANGASRARIPASRACPAGRTRTWPTSGTTGSGRGNGTASGSGSAKGIAKSTTTTTRTTIEMGRVGTRVSRTGIGHHGGIRSLAGRPLRRCYRRSLVRSESNSNPVAKTPWWSSKCPTSGRNSVPQPARRRPTQARCTWWPSPPSRWIPPVSPSCHRPL